MLPILLKEAVRTLVTPGTPPRGPVPAIPFRMYGCPLPIGYCYNQYQVGGVGPLLPNSAATFSGWMQVRIAPTEYTTTVMGVEYRTLAELFALYPGGVVPTAEWSPVYEEIEGELTLVGYTIPVAVPGSEPLPPRYHAGAAHMTMITFEDDEAESGFAENGYPLGPGPYTGYFDVVTQTGVARVTNVYIKKEQGLLLPTSGTPLPDYCVRSGSAQVVMLAGFPGRAAVAEVPAVYSTDDVAGWNAGGNSLEVIDTDARTVFQIELRTAIAVGFAHPSRGYDTSLATLQHALYFDMAGTGRYVVRVIERGAIKAVLGQHLPEQEYKIERVDGIVTYYIDDVAQYTSLSMSTGEIVVGSALYRAGDGVY